MSVFTRRPALRWVVPAAVAAVALTAGIAGPALVADADPALPPRSAAQLLVDLQTSAVTGLSGTVVHKADLGLPTLPVTAPGGTDLMALAGGTQTVRVWYGGPDRQRVALLGTLGETDLVRNGSDAWIWSSSTNEASHYRLPAEGAADGPAAPTDVPSTPQEAAEQALAAIDPTTEVGTDGTATVAGRAAYELVLRPRDDASLVGQVRIAIDAEQQVPLRVRVYAADAVEPAIETGFTQISFVTPDAAHFEFRPPPGAVVTEQDAADPPSAEPGGPVDVEPEVVGTGWTSVLVLAAPAEASAEDPGPDGPGGAPGGASSNELDGVLGSLPQVSGSWGSGRLLAGDLFSVLLTDDGTVYAGLVTPQRLYDVAAG